MRPPLPICALVPVISWGVYIMGLIDAELEKIPNLADSSWNLFFRSDSLPVL